MLHVVRGKTFIFLSAIVRKMTENLVFIITFVKSIEKHFFIWNYTLTEYSKHNLIEKVWMEVANEVQDLDSFI